MAGAGTEQLCREIERVMPQRPFTMRFWDGGLLAANGDGGPTLTVKSPRAIGHLLRAPSQLGLGRAYVSGDIEVDDIDRVMDLIGNWAPPPVSLAERARLMLIAARAAGLQKPPARPAAELRPSGRRHSRERDARAVRHHYDVSNEFFELFLDESLAYSCGFFSRVAADGRTITDPLGGVPRDEGASLEAAQHAKLDLTARKLQLEPGMRVLDVGCGWGSFVRHVAENYEVDVVGITLSEPQAEGARRRAEAAGVADRVEIRVMDYRELAGERFDAIASIGMVEHVGEDQIDIYAQRLAGLIRPGGRLLNHGIARLRHSDPAAGAFSERYVFPDAEPLHLSRVLLALERAGFVTHQVEGFASDYAETLTHWIERLDANLPRAIELAGEERVRVWRLYLRAARNGFRIGFTSIYQSLCVAPD